MKIFSLTLLLSLCLSATIFAQNPNTIKGIVSDTSSFTRLQNATISILNAKDSTLYKYTRAAENGTFSIAPMKKGNFILLLTYPNYVDYVAPFTLTEEKNSLDFKLINMDSKANLLKEVIFKGQATAIKIKGDTTEFNAAAYTIQPNDKVEDLLKKFPGLQIDKDGKITAQGKTVSKVLVDGAEFFGDDPTLVTKNLRADMVDKVQLFDKSSDQAAFTGVDDGNKQTTLNIQLKESAKNGYFGKVDLGVGTEGFYDGQLMFNKFKAKQKFSIYGTTGNNGRTGLDWDDANKYGSGSGNVEFMDGGMMVFYGGGDDMDYGGGYFGEGIPTSRNGGAHYDTKWNKDKETINTNYKIGSLGVKANKNTLNQNNLPTGIINTNSDDLTDNYSFRQKLDATYTIKLDTSSNLKIIVDGTLKNSTSKSQNTSIGSRINNTLLNTSNRTNDNEGEEQAFNVSALYNRKLKKLGRNFSINLSQRINKKNSEGYLKSLNNFYDINENLTNSERIDQLKTNDITTNSFSSNFTYNEPITKDLSLVFNYGISYNNSQADKKSYNASVPGRYDLLDTEYSNDFTANQLINQGGAIFNYRKPKTTINFGTRISAINFDQFEAYSNQKYKRSFINWTPQASYQYKFSAQRSLRFGYNGYTNQPTVEQLQPVKVNTDPLNIPLGNPNLKPSYNNSLNINYNSYKMLTNQSLYVSGNFSFVNNQIVNNTSTDAEGRSIRQSINLTEKTPFNFNMFSYISKKIKALGIDAGLNLSTGGGKSYSYINQSLNETYSFRLNPSLQISRFKDKFEFNLQFGPSYSLQEASIQKNLNNEGWGSSGYGSFKIVLPKKITISSDARYTYSPKTASFNNSNEQIIINAELSKSFFKKNDLTLKVKGNDLLNQNKGFNRYASGNSITQTSYNTITRYYMFSLIWDFNKMGETK